MKRLALVFAALSATAATAADGKWQDQPARYFVGEHPDIDVTYIHYGPFGRGFETGFAVGRVCTEGQICAGGIKETVIRVVRRLPETGNKGVIDYAWLETSLDACPAAHARLKRLPDARWAPHMRMALQSEHPGPENITVTTYEGQVSILTASAGERVEGGTLRLLSGEYQFRGNADGSGNPADWAEALLLDIEPCLRPATIAPPWAR